MIAAVHADVLVPADVVRAAGEVAQFGQTAADWVFLRAVSIVGVEVPLCHLCLHARLG